MIKAQILDPEDGESGIVEVMSGRVLERFPSLRHAAQTLRRNRAKYEMMSPPPPSPDQRRAEPDQQNDIEPQAVHGSLHGYGLPAHFGEVIAVIGGLDELPTRVGGAGQ